MAQPISHTPSGRSDHAAPMTLLSAGGLASQLSALLCPSAMFSTAASGPPPVWSDGVPPLLTPSNRPVSFTADAIAPADLPPPLCSSPLGPRAASRLCALLVSSAWNTSPGHPCAYHASIFAETSLSQRWHLPNPGKMATPAPTTLSSNALFGTELLSHTASHCSKRLTNIRSKCTSSPSAQGRGPASVGSRRVWSGDQHRGHHAVIVFTGLSQTPTSSSLLDIPRVRWRVEGPTVTVNR